MVIDPDYFTTLAFVTFDRAGDRSFSFARKPGADTQLRWEEVDKDLIDEARVFHFGTLSLTDEPVRTATQKAVTYAKQTGKLISCDPNLRVPLWRSEEEAREQMLWSLQQADRSQNQRQRGFVSLGLFPGGGRGKASARV